MAARGVVIRPVDDASPRIPFVFAVKFYPISFLKSIDSIGQIDVMSDQQRLSRLQFDNEALVSAAVIVVGEYRGDDSFILNLNATSPIGKCLGKCLVASRYAIAATRRSSHDQATFE